MSQLVACPDCKKHLQVPDDLIGKKVQCPECKATFTAKSPDEEEVRSKVGTTIARPPASKQAAWDQEDDNDNDDDDERGSRSSSKKKRRDDDDDDDRDDDDELPRRSRRRRSSRGNYAAHRGGLILAFGLIGLIGFFTHLLFPIVFGIIAWVMGNADMAEIRQGRMDPEGEGMTQAGRIMGMIAVILHIILLLGWCAFIGIWFLCVGMIVAGGAGAGANQPRRKF